MPSTFVERMGDAHDLGGLQKALRNRRNPEMRKDAAVELGLLGDLEAVEPLARAVLQDPDPEVQKIARRALADLIGAEANTVLATYRHHLSVTGAWQSDTAAGRDDGEYLLDTPTARQETQKDETFEEWEDSYEESDQAPDEEEWDKQNLDGIITVLSHESNPKIRLQAIQALQNSSNMRAIEILSAIALDDENEELSTAARAALEKRFGESASEIIESYRKRAEGEEAYSGEEEDFEDEEPEETEPVYPGPADTPRTASSFGDYSRSSVIQEDRIGWRLILLVILVLLIVGGVAFFLLSR